jgi:hypothetical protein
MVDWGTIRHGGVGYLRDGGSVKHVEASRGSSRYDKGGASAPFLWPIKDDCRVVKME